MDKLRRFLSADESHAWCKAMLDLFMIKKYESWEIVEINLEKWNLEIPIARFPPIESPIKIIFSNLISWRENVRLDSQKK